MASRRNSRETKPVRAQADDRGGIQRLLLVSGPILQWGGWAAAFTSVGATLIVAGTFASLAGIAVRPGWRSAVAGGASALAGGWGWYLPRWFLG